MAEVNVVNNRAENRFEVSEGGALAELVYRQRPGVIVFVHTGVPDTMEGRGVGGALAKAGLEFAKGEGLQVEPRCSFVTSYIQRHPEYLDLVTPEFRAHVTKG